MKITIVYSMNSDILGGFTIVINIYEMKSTKKQLSAILDG